MRLFLFFCFEVVELYKGESVLLYVYVHESGVSAYWSPLSKEAAVPHGQGGTQRAGMAVGGVRGATLLSRMYMSFTMT